uniref:purine-nucleoside phosphorylase n=1 Tax=Anser brachyrhynchus TaxID=132585 RepID=A0A8B9BPB7_9AVES
MFLTPMSFTPSSSALMFLTPMFLTPKFFNPMFLTPISFTPLFLTPMSFTPSSSTPMFLTPLFLHPTSSTLAVPRPESPSPKVLRPDALAPRPQVVLPVRALRLLGVHTLVLTNAAGSLSPALGPGDLMVIKDHIDLPGLAGRGPLVGPNDERFGPRFPTMLDAYDPELRRLALAMAPPELRAREGVYAGVGGPSYETVAECRFLQRAGADAVGMSTVSEAVAARHCGLRVLGLSLITNAAPLPPEDGGPAPEPPAGHQEVLEAASAGARHLRELLARLAPRLDAGHA